MNIEQLFAKPLKRDINGVVKAEQVQEKVVFTELDEYVVTQELDKHFRSFFENYLSTIDQPESASEKMGVWISGFFGSGKSHFLKILSYLLGNRVVTQTDGQTAQAVDFFEEKFTDSLLFNDIKRAVKRPSDVILFNIDSRANTDDKDSAILKVFLKVFNAQIGYCAEFPHIAHLERELDKKGQYQRFKSAFQSRAGSSWEAERDAFDFFRDEMIEALSEASGQSIESATKWLASIEDNFPLSIRNFSQWVADYLSDTPEKNLLFLVDEVGQFIGKNSQMMLQLQTIVENLGVATQGRAWVIVTAQADIDAAIGQLNKNQGDDFSKIQGRFATRLTLSSSNTAEVIQKRLLTKTSEASSELTRLYQDKADILKNQLAFQSTAFLPTYDNATDFVDNYPFIPYHYPLVQKVFESIRTKGATGKHLAMGERSLLDAFQSAAKQIMQAAPGELIPFDRFYTPIEGFLETAVKRTVDQAAHLEQLTQFDSRLLKTLFMIRYVDAVKATVDNLATLMVDQIDADKRQLRKDIESSLVRLENQLLIARNGDEYNFLTNEEKEIENEIRHTEVEPTAVNQKLSEILFDQALKGHKAYRYPVNHQEFKVSRFCNSHPKDGSTQEDLNLYVVTPIDMDYEKFQSEAHAKQYSLDKESLLVVLEDDKALWEDLETYVKTAKYLKHNNEVGKEHLIRDKHLENNDRLKRLHRGIETLLTQARFYAIGTELTNKGQNPVHTLETGYEFIIENTFAKLRLLTPYSGADIQREIQSVLAADDAAQIGLDLNDPALNPQALKEVENYIGLKTDRSEKVMVKPLLQHFGRRPYGWPDAEVLLLLARLALAGKVDFVYQANVLSLPKAYESLTHSRKQADVQIRKVRQHDEAMLSKAKKLHKEAFNKTFTDEGEKALAESFKKELSYWQTQLHQFASQSQALACPGGDAIEQGRVLVANLLDQANSFDLIQALVQHKDDLLDFSEDFEDLENFFTSQFDVWKNLHQSLNVEFKPNLSALEKDASAAKALKQLRDIKQSPAPYAQLKNVPGLVAEVQKVNQELIQDKRAQALAKVQQRIDRLTDSLDEAKAPDDLRNKVLYPLQQCKHVIETVDSVPEMFAQQSDSGELEETAQEQVNAFIRQQREAAQAAQKTQETETDATGGSQDSAGQGYETSSGSQASDHPPLKAAEPMPKPIHTLNPAECAPSGYIETEQDITRYLDQLREKLDQAIAAGERVRIK